MSPLLSRPLSLEPNCQPVLKQDEDRKSPREWGGCPLRERGEPPRARRVPKIPSLRPPVISGRSGRKTSRGVTRRRWKISRSQVSPSKPPFRRFRHQYSAVSILPFFCLPFPVAWRTDASLLRRAQCEFRLPLRSRWFHGGYTFAWNWKLTWSDVYLG